MCTEERTNMTIEAFSEHLIKCHIIEQFSCHICNVKSTNFDFIKKHKLEVHGIKLFTFTHEETPPLKKKTKVKQRVMKTEGSGDNANSSAICEMCGYVGESYLGMAKHKKNEHKTEILPCNQCKRTFTTFVTLKHHMTKAHKTYKHCDQCEYKTYDKNEMKKHMKTRHASQV